MNQMTPAEITAILKAEKAGALIEMNSLSNLSDSGWIPWGKTGWDFNVLAYRVYKPNPKITISLNSTYSAVVDPVKQEIKVGCVTITKNKIAEIQKALDQERKIYVVSYDDRSINVYNDLESARHCIGRITEVTLDPLTKTRLKMTEVQKKNDYFESLQPRSLVPQHGLLQPR